MGDNLVVHQATYITSYLIYSGINREKIRAISGALINRLYLDQPIPRDKFAEITEESTIPLNIVPDKPVVKMAKRQHVEAFFQNGALRLGTFSYYNHFDHEEIGDTSEGSFVLVGQHTDTTAFAEIAGGFNNYLFCCYGGAPDPECVERFGYDSNFTIVDIEGFASTIGKHIGAVDYRFAQCAYARDKVVIGTVDRDFDFNTISPRLLDLATEAKYFLKPDKYAHQSEFRITWQMTSDVDLPLDILCPEAIEYCKT